MPMSPSGSVSILSKLDSGDLPRNAPKKMFASYGHGHPCSGCGEVIYAAQVEYEMDYGDGVTCRMHLGCAALWDAECRRRGYRRNETPATRAGDRWAS